MDEPRRLMAERIAWRVSRLPGPWKDYERVLQIVKEEERSCDCSSCKEGTRVHNWGGLA